ncbi:MAG TPA: hypothetical protein VFV57_06035 [Limnobacter sp.]|nr:hypothetical protein [Limnobacter sp.]
MSNPLPEVTTSTTMRFEYDLATSPIEQCEKYFMDCIVPMLQSFADAALKNPQFERDVANSMVNILSLHVGYTASCLEQPSVLAMDLRRMADHIDRVAENKVDQAQHSSAGVH